MALNCNDSVLGLFWCSLRTFCERTTVSLHILTESGSPPDSVLQRAGGVVILSWCAASTPMRACTSGVHYVSSLNVINLKTTTFCRHGGQRTKDLLK